MVSKSSTHAVAPAVPVSSEQQKLLPQPFSKLLKNTVLVLYSTPEFLYCANLDRTFMKWSPNGDLCLLVVLDYTIWSVQLHCGLLLTGCSDGVIRKWSLTDHMCSTLTGHEKHVRCMTAAESFVYSGSYDCTIKKWNTDNECLATLVGHQEAVNDLVFFGNCIYSASVDSTIRKWNSQDQLVVTLRGHHSSSVRCLAVCQGTLYSGGADNTIKRWTTQDTVEKMLHGHRGPVCCLTVFNGQLYSGSGDSYIKRWNVSETAEDCVATIDIHSSAVTALAVFDGALYSGGEDRHVRKLAFFNEAQAIT